MLIYNVSYHPLIGIPVDTLFTKLQRLEQAPSFIRISQNSLNSHSYLMKSYFQKVQRIDDSGPLKLILYYSNLAFKKLSLWLRGLGRLWVSHSGSETWGLEHTIEEQSTSPSINLHIDTFTQQAKYLNEWPWHNTPFEVPLPIWDNQPS